MIRCKICQKENDSGVAFCLKCNAPLGLNQKKDFLAIVDTPAGPPPCKPQDTEKDSIIEWIYDVLNKGRDKDVQYTASAVKYYAASFWDMHQPQYKQICTVIDENFPIY